MVLENSKRKQGEVPRLSLEMRIAVMKGFLECVCVCVLVLVCLFLVVGALPERGAAC